METTLEWIGFYTSPPGGSKSPYVIRNKCIVFELITEGEVYCPENDTLHGPGTIFAHTAGQKTVHQVEGKKHYSCMTAKFSWATAPDIRWLRNFYWNDKSSFLQFIEEMIQAFHHEDIDKSVLQELIWGQLRFRLEQEKLKRVERALPNRIHAILNYIEKNHAKNLGIETIANEFDLSASHIHNLFRDQFNKSPHQYLIDYRMRTAKYKLVTSNAPIKSLSQKIGYQSHENFCRAFKKHFKVTAAAYRKQYKYFDTKLK